MQIQRKHSYFPLLFSGGIDSSQPMHSVSQSILFSKPGAGTSTSSAVISSVRTPAPSLSSQPRSSPSVTQSPELALQEGTKREWEVTVQTSALFHMCTWMLEALLLLFCICLDWSTSLASHQAPLVFLFSTTLVLASLSSFVWFPLAVCHLWLVCLVGSLTCLFLKKPFS